MPSLKNYRLFVSHSWAYEDAYDKLVSFFNEHPNFQWTNYSVPKKDPIHDAPQIKRHSTMPLKIRYHRLTV
jgi:hypothetical protein